MAKAERMGAVSQGVLASSPRSGPKAFRYRQLAATSALVLIPLVLIVVRMYGGAGATGRWVPAISKDTGFRFLSDGAGASHPTVTVHPVPAPTLASVAISEGSSAVQVNGSFNSRVTTADLRDTADISTADASNADAITANSITADVSTADPNCTLDGTGPRCADGDLLASPPVLPVVLVTTHIRPLVAACVKALRLHNPEAPIYLVTTKGSMTVDFEQTQELLTMNRLFVKFVEEHMENGTDSAAFAERYIHQSVNPAYFELFCFQRFFILRDIAREKGFGRFVTLDTDVALFGAMEDFTQYNKDLVLLDECSTWFSVWTLRMLERFCQFGLEFYNRPSDLIRSDWEKYGEADFVDGKAVNVSFSDMFLLNAFIRTNSHRGYSILSLLADEGYSPSERERVFRYLPTLNAMNVFGFERRREDVRRYLQWRTDERGRLIPYATSLLQLSGERTAHDPPVRLQGLHWQGYAKELGLEIMQSVLEGRESDLRLDPGSKEVVSNIRRLLLQKFEGWRNRRSFRSSRVQDFSWPAYLRAGVY